MGIKYENHNYIDPNFPIFFHLDRRKNNPEPHLHWHEHVELIYVTEGVCVVHGNGVEITAAPRSIVMITPNCEHEFGAEGDSCAYYCITVEKGFCDNFGVPVRSGQFAAMVTDKTAIDCYESMIELMHSQPSYYRTEAKALVIRLLTICCRNAESTDRADKETEHSQMVTAAIDYLRAHCCEPVAVDELCAYLGFSKYYLCRKFKAETGKTIVDYLNFLRCSNARRLIASGQYNVSESARRSGFNNMSYFTRTYRKQLGCTPSNSKVTPHKK